MGACDAAHVTGAFEHSLIFQHSELPIQYKLQSLLRSISSSIKSNAEIDAANSRGGLILSEYVPNHRKAWLPQAPPD